MGDPANVGFPAQFNPELMPRSEADMKIDIAVLKATNNNQEVLLQEVRSTNQALLVRVGELEKFKERVGGGWWVLVILGTITVAGFGLLYNIKNIWPWSKS